MVYSPRFLLVLLVGICIMSPLILHRRSTVAAIETPPDILDQTNQCWAGYACLTEGKCRCELWYHSVAMNVLFLCNTPPRDCPYAFPFALSHFCRCPTHYYLVAREEA